MCGESTYLVMALMTRTDVLEADTASLSRLLAYVGRHPGTDVREDLVNAACDLLGLPGLHSCKFVDFWRDSDQLICWGCGELKERLKGKASVLTDEDCKENVGGS